MKFQDAMMAAQALVEQVENDPMGKPVRLRIDEANKVLIEELISMCQALPYLNSRVMGQVGRKNGWFELSAKIDKPGGEVIHVDFRAKKVISRTAA